MGNPHAFSTYMRAHHGAFRDITKFVANLKQAIDDEASAVQFYTQLQAITPADHRDLVAHALEDEKTHLKMLRRLYRKLTAREAEVRPAMMDFRDYKQGVELAFRRELEAAETYRDMYLNAQSPGIRDVLFRIMTDEMEHAQRFTFLYATP